MKPFDAALARSRTYALLAQLYRAGLTPALWPAVRAVPVLAEALDQPFDPEGSAADHYDLFHLNVFPYASLFLDPAGHLGGPVTDDARRLFRQAGYTADPAGEDADHISHALDLLAFLSGAEADALEDERPDEADRMRDLQRHALDAYLLWWLPPLTQAVQQQQHPFYTLLADLTLDLVIDHRDALGAATDDAFQAPRLPDPPPLLDDPSTGLKDIAAYLASPPCSGLYLSRTAISRLARHAEVPRGFGTRVQMLTNLLRAAVTFDQLDPLLCALADVEATWRTRYAALTYPNLPILNAVTQTWLTRLGTTRQILARLRSGAMDASAEEDAVSEREERVPDTESRT